MSDGPEARPLGAAPQRAAQYLRMSTEHQEYSLDNQATAIQSYAETHGYEVVRTYMDSGKSGLTFEHRKGLQALIADVQSKPDFECVLVYDVSRWGRFQDMDASAHYEYACRKAGVPIVYCMEVFETGDAPLDAIAKFLKRYMAAEKSRELSVKVFEGQNRIIRLGFKPGGMAGFGLRRMLVNRAGTPKGILDFGERKAFKTDRVVFAMGPESEAEAVRLIFELRTREKMSFRRIAARLNASGIPRHDGRVWREDSVCKLIRNPKYMGVTAWNRSSQKLRSPSRPNDRAKWVLVPGTHDAIVSADAFEAAQIEKAKRVIVEEEDVLSGLRALLLREGKLSYSLITREKGLQAPKTYAARFGSLANAYRLVGYEPKQDFSVQKRLRDDVIQRVFERLRDHGRSVKMCYKLRRIIVDEILRIAVTIAPCHLDSRAERHWPLRQPDGPIPEFIIWGRRGLDMDELQDFCFAQSDGRRWDAFSMDQAGHRIPEMPVARARLATDLDDFVGGFF